MDPQEIIDKVKKVLSFGITCISGLDDEEFSIALEELNDSLMEWQKKLKLIP